MADDFARIQPVSQHFRDPGAREETLPGRHARKSPGSDAGPGNSEPDEFLEDEAEDAAPGNHIDFRI